MKRREHISLDLTPVIDVVFILLIFFIVTSVFKKNELALMLDLPESGAKSIEVEQEQIFIELNEKKLAIKGKEIDFADLDKKLQKIKDKKRAVIIKIDKNTKYDRVTRILDLLQKHNLNNLALITKEKK